MSYDNLQTNAKGLPHAHYGKSFFPDEDEGPSLYDQNQLQLCNDFNISTSASTRADSMSQIPQLYRESRAFTENEDCLKSSVVWNNSSLISNATKCFSSQTHGCADGNLSLTKKKRSVKNNDQSQKPKRPLSAYNVFFHHERQNILQQMPTRAQGKPRRSHGKIGFADLARSIASKWKSLSDDERKPFIYEAYSDKDRYSKEMEIWKEAQFQEVKQASNTASFINFNAMRSNVFDGMVHSFNEPSQISANAGGGQLINVMPKQRCEKIVGLIPKRDIEPSLTIANAFELYCNQVQKESNSESFNMDMFNTNIQYREQIYSSSMIPNVLVEGNSKLMTNNDASFPIFQQDVEVSFPNQISELATKLDDESTQLLLNMFR